MGPAPFLVAGPPRPVSSSGPQPTGAAEEGSVDVFGTVRDARAAIRDLPLGADLKERAALVVTELATNAVLHAGGFLYVRLRYSDGHLRLEVADASGSMPERSAPGNMSGRGLLIVAALASSWGAQPVPGGKVVWAEIC